MADDDADDLDEGADADVEEDEDGEGPPRKRGGKKKIILVALAALLLVVGGAAAAFFTGALDPLVKMIAGGEETAESEEVVETNVVFYDMPELLVNLNTGARKSTFLKISVSLELEKPEDIPRIERLMPRIVDNFQVYLRELRIEDLKGSAGMYRLREELLARVGVAIAPTRVNDILFKEMLVQ